MIGIEAKIDRLFDRIETQGNAVSRTEAAAHDASKEARRTRWTLVITAIGSTIAIVGVIVSVLAFGIQMFDTAANIFTAGQSDTPATGTRP